MYLVELVSSLFPSLQLKNYGDLDAAGIQKEKTQHVGFLADFPAPDELTGEPQSVSLAPGVTAKEAAVLLCCPQPRFMQCWDREKPLKRAQGPVWMNLLARKSNVGQSKLQVHGVTSVTLGWR